jgi:hypothetical protein
MINLFNDYCNGFCTRIEVFPDAPLKEAEAETVHCKTEDESSPQNWIC